jgi:hypothetical protein
MGLALVQPTSQRTSTDLINTQENTMQHGSDWWQQCAFICDYFFDEQKKIAHRLAEYLARYYVGDGVSDLKPDTDVSALVGDSIRRYINRDDFTMARDDGPFADIDLKESVSFKEIVNQVHSRQGLSTSLN